MFMQSIFRNLLIINNSCKIVFTGKGLGVVDTNITYLKGQIFTFVLSMFKRIT